MPHVCKFSSSLLVHGPEQIFLPFLATHCEQCNFEECTEMLKKIMIVIPTAKL